MAQNGNSLDGGHSWVRAGNSAGAVDGELNGQTLKGPVQRFSDADSGVRGTAPVAKLVANAPLPSEQVSMLPSEQSNLLDLSLPSEQSENDKQKAEWLKTLLPKLSAGWWDVAANGKGFIIKQKWREHKKQITQTYPRVSREQFQTLKAQEYGYAKQLVADKIWEHIDECRKRKLKSTRERAGLAAARLGIAH